MESSDVDGAEREAARLRAMWRGIVEGLSGTPVSSYVQVIMQSVMKTCGEGGTYGKRGTYAAHLSTFTHVLQVLHRPAGGCKLLHLSHVNARNEQLYVELYIDIPPFPAHRWGLRSIPTRVRLADRT